MLRKGCLVVSILLLAFCVASFALSTFDQVKIIGKWEVKEVPANNIRMQKWKAQGMTKMYYEYNKNGELCIERHFKDEIKKDYNRCKCF